MNLVQRKDGVDVFDHYDLISVIKSGSMGTVSLIEKKKKEKTGNPNYNSRNLKYLPGLFHPSGRLRPNYSKATAAAESKQQAFALKTIQLTRIPDENKIHALKNEIDILQQCDHPNIVKVYDVFTIQRQISLVLELCLGGELYTRLPYSESQAKTILQQIFSAVAYLHRRKIIHRDLKFENILFQSNLEGSADTKKSWVVKVIDFGLSKRYLPGVTMDEIVGTVYSSAPELLKGVYDQQADIWSVGVICYMLLSGGDKPFQEKWRRFLIEKIQKADYLPLDDQEVLESTGVVVSEAARMFCYSLLQLDPKKRPTAEEVLKSSSWLTEKTDDDVNNDKVVETLSESIANKLVDGLRNMEEKQGSTTARKRRRESVSIHKNDGIKNIVLTMMAHHSSPEEIQHLRDAFLQYDTAGDGVIHISEFQQAIRDYTHATSLVGKEVFDKLDADNKGFIEYTEFVASTLEVSGLIAEDRIAEAFDRLDADGTGYISIENLKDVLPHHTEKELEAYIQELDVNSDGKISFKELLLVFRDKRTVKCRTPHWRHN